MSNYVKATNFAIKDTLANGDPNKAVKGTEINTEFAAIESAVSSKADVNSPTFTGVPAAPTATTGANTTQLANTAFVKTALDSLGNMSTQNKTAVDITGGTIVGITDLAVADGGTGQSSYTDGQLLIGNSTGNTLTKATLTAGANITITNGNGAITIAAGSGGGGSVTSVATGNGLSGGTITSTGTLAIACPGFNTVGSYCFGGSYFNQTYSGGSTHAAGTGTNEVQPMFMAVTDSNTARLLSASSVSATQLSGTWKLMSCIGFAGVGTDSASLFCRVS